MSTYTQIIYQIVFGTKHREKTLNTKHHDELFKYISGVVRNNNCHLFRVNGTKDHLHIVTDLHPTVALSNLIKDIKLSTTSFIKKEKLFPKFKGWQNDYGAFTYSIKEKDRLIEYVKNQKTHHTIPTFEEEYKKLLLENGVEFDPKYLI